MTDDELKDAKRCLWFVLYGAITCLLVFNAPKDKSEKLYDTDMRATVIISCIAVSHFLIWRLVNPERDSPVEPPKPKRKPRSYVYSSENNYEGRCFNCKKPLNSAFNKMCRYCRSYECNRCGKYECDNQKTKYT